MKKTIKVLAIVMTLALVMSLAAVSAFAVSGGETSFEKKFVIPSSANVPNTEFVYTIVPGTAVPIGADNEVAIKAGLTNAVDGVTYPTIEHAVFPTNDNPATAVAADPDDSTKKIAVDNVKIDLTGINFTEPGVYRYIVTETNNNVPGVIYPENEAAVRYLDLFVFEGDHDNDASTPDQLYVQTYSLKTVASNFEKVYDEDEGKWKYQYVTEPTVKSSGYENELETVDLSFTKDITGNQADLTEKFTFTLRITGAIPNSQYDVTVVGSNVITDGSGVTDGKITVDQDGAYTGTFSLTKGDVVTVSDLPVGYGYTVTEEAQDYTSTASTVTGYTDPTTGTNVDADKNTSYTNSREGIIPTGVIITVAPFAIGILVFGAVILYMISRRRRLAY